MIGDSLVLLPGQSFTNVDTQQENYKVWAVDNLIYGPIELPTLIEWVLDQRVLPDTWVHADVANKWQHAREIPELKGYFTGLTDTTLHRRAEHGSLTPDELRQFPEFAGLSNNDLEEFIRFGELCPARPGELIIQKGAPCDAVYFVVSGEVRVRMMIGLQDITLAKIPAGEFFGEVGMFIQSTRTADVVAEQEVRLLRMSAESFQLMIREIPQLAAPLMFALAKIMAHRIADDNQRLQKEVSTSFLWR